MTIVLREINFDGIVGPGHNFAGLSLGNLAVAHNAGKPSHPRDAALQGVAKMRVNLDLGLAQAMFFPHARPDDRWLRSLSTSMADATLPRGRTRCRHRRCRRPMPGPCRQDPTPPMGGVT